MAESLGVEPSDRITTVYGLAIRCITVLPALDILLYSRRTFASNKFGGPTGNRTPTRGLQSHCAPVITISPNLASPEGLEPPRTVLETDMLPLHQRDLTHCLRHFSPYQLNACIKTYC